MENKNKRPLQILLYIGLFASVSIVAATLTEFCRNRIPVAKVKALLDNPNNRMAFNNGAYGLANGGVCWWHSRFQRNALYMANFDPSGDRPTLDEAKKIIKDIRRGKKVINVPGFANLKAFSRAYKTEIVKELESWQLFDGFLQQRWVQGLAGSSRSASAMKEQMDEVYDRVNNEDEIAYMKVQLPGITAHAILVNKVEKTSNGYRLTAVDSNRAGGTVTYNYKNGDDSFDLVPAVAYGSKNRFVPHVEFTREVKRLKKVVSKACGNIVSQAGSDAQRVSCDGGDPTSAGESRSAAVGETATSDDSMVCGNPRPKDISEEADSEDDYDWDAYGE